MGKLLSALTITLLLTSNALADTNATTTEPPADDLAAVVILIIAIAIPNLIKSRPA